LTGYEALGMKANKKTAASVEVRRLTIKVDGAMVKVWKHAGLPYKPKGRDSPEVVTKLMLEFPSFFIGAFVEDRPVGVVIGSCETRMKGWINRLAVDPQYQRQGIAQQLVTRMEEELKEHGTKIFCALIETPNEESEGVFRRLGYALHRNILYATKRESQDT
jgi:ribosomal protein S18 acetylase RimI-like enzyme